MIVCMSLNELNIFVVLAPVIEDINLDAPLPMLNTIPLLPEGTIGPPGLTPLEEIPVP